MARLSATLMLSLQIVLPLCAAVSRPGKYYTTMSPTATTTSPTTSSTTTQPVTDFQGIGSTDILDTTTTASTTTASTTTASTTTASTTTASTTTASTSTTTEPTTSTTTTAPTTTTTETTSTATTTGSLSTDLQVEDTTTTGRSTAVRGQKYRATTADMLNFSVDYDADGDDGPDYPDFPGRLPFGRKKKYFKKIYPAKDLNLVPLSFNVDFIGEPKVYNKHGKPGRYPPFPGRVTTTQATTTLVTDAQGVSETDTTAAVVTTTEPTTTTETTVTTTEEETTTTETTVTTTEEETTTTETTVTTTEPTTTTETTVTTTEPTTTTETTVTTTESETTTTEDQTTTTSTESTSLVTDLQGSQTSSSPRSTSTIYPPAPYNKPPYVVPYGAILVAVVPPKTYPRRTGPAATKQSSYPRRTGPAATKQSSYLDYCRPRTTGNLTRTRFQPRSAFLLRTQAGQEFDASGEADSYRQLVAFYSLDADLPQSGYTQSTTVMDFANPSQALDKVVDVPTTVPLTYTVNKELSLYDFPPERSNLADFCSSVDRIYRVVPSPNVAAARQVTVLNQSGAVRIYIREAAHSS